MPSLSTRSISWPTSTVVLPLPADAETRMFRSRISTARRCCSFHFGMLFLLSFGICACSGDDGFPDIRLSVIAAAVMEVEVGAGIFIRFAFDRAGQDALGQPAQQPLHPFIQRLRLAQRLFRIMQDDISFLILLQSGHMGAVIIEGADVCREDPPVEP